MKTKGWIMPMQMEYFLMIATLIAVISLGAHAGEGQASAVPDKARLSVGG